MAVVPAAPLPGPDPQPAPAVPQPRVGGCYIMAMDTETTGLSPRFHRMIQIGVVGQAPDDEMVTFLQTVRTVPPFISQLTHIQTSDLAAAPSPAEALRLCEARWAGRPHVVLAGYNLGFDLAFLFEELRTQQLRLALPAWAVDLLPLCKQLFPRLKNHKLATVYRHCFREDFPSAHRADADARATLRLALHLQSHLSRAKVPVATLFWAHRERMDRLWKRPPSLEKLDAQTVLCRDCGSVCSLHFVHVCGPRAAAPDTHRAAKRLPAAALCPPRGKRSK